MSSLRKFMPFLLSLFIATLYLREQHFAFLLRGLIQYFFPGVSPWKGLIFIIALGSLMTLRGLLHLKASKTFVAAALRSLLLLQLSGMGLHIYFSLKYHIPVGTRAIAVHDGLQSVNSWIHLHVTKGISAALIALTNFNLPIFGDAGTPFLVLIPQGVFYVLLPLSIATVTFCLMTILSCRITCPATGSSSGWLPVAIAMLMCLKSTFDGGLCAPENLAGWGVLILLFYYPEWFFKQSSVLAMASAVCAAILQILSEETSLFFMTRDTFKTFCALLLLSQLSSARSLRARIIPGILLTAAALLTIRHSYWISEAKQMLQRVENKAIISLDRNRQLPGQLLYHTGDLRVFEYQTPAPVRVVDLHQSLGIPSGYLLVNIDGQTCTMGAPFYAQGTVIAINGNYDARLAGDEIFSDFQTSECLPSEHCTFHYRAEIRGCVSNHFSMAEVSFLSAHGLKTFILIPEPI